VGRRYCDETGYSCLIPAVIDEHRKDNPLIEPCNTTGGSGQCNIPKPVFLVILKGYHFSHSRQQRIWRGTPNRFGGNLLLFMTILKIVYHTFKDSFVSCTPKVKVKILPSNYVDLHTPKSFTHSDSLLVREGCKTQAIF
jgi:hypothetical protein